MLRSLEAQSFSKSGVWVGLFGVIWGLLGYTLGLYRDTGKENGNHYNVIVQCRPNVCIAGMIEDSFRMCSKPSTLNPESFPKAWILYSGF